jgi:hypothetical protein
MNGRLRIAVAELFLLARNRSEFWGSRFPEENRCKEILLVFVYCKPLSLYGGCCSIKFRSESASCFQQELHSSFGATDEQRQFSGRRWRLLERAELQLERRQAQVRRQLDRQCERQLRFRVRLRFEVSPTSTGISKGCLLCYLLADLIQPPNILPISSIIV